MPPINRPRRNLIEAEDHLDRYIEVVLPNLSWKVALELLFFVYNDELSRTIDPASDMHMLVAPRRYTNTAC